MKYLILLSLALFFSCSTSTTEPTPGKILLGKIEAVDGDALSYSELNEAFEADLGYDLRSVNANESFKTLFYVMALTRSYSTLLFRPFLHNDLEEGITSYPFFGDSTVIITQTVVVNDSNYTVNVKVNNEPWTEAIYAKNLRSGYIKEYVGTFQKHVDYFNSDEFSFSESGINETQYAFYTDDRKKVLFAHDITSQIKLPDQTMNSQSVSSGQIDLNADRSGELNMTGTHKYSGLSVGNSQRDIDIYVRWNSEGEIIEKRGTDPFSN